jgi:hypothetical protein
MLSGLNRLSLGAAIVCGISACGAAGAAEPSESQMKDAMLYAMNHPPGGGNSEPITIKSFKKEGCENPTPRGYSCGFDVVVASSNIGASMYNNISMGIFYVDKDTGKWAMRPPF